MLWKGMATSEIQTKMNADLYSGFPGLDIPNLKAHFSMIIMTPNGWNISCQNNNKEQGVFGDDFVKQCIADFQIDENFIKVFPDTNNL